MCGGIGGGGGVYGYMCVVGGVVCRAIWVGLVVVV